MVSRSLPLIAVLLGLLGAPAATRGQDSNITLAVDTLERLLGVEKFEVANFGPLRSATDRVRVALLSFPGGHSVRVKWAAAARGGDTFNNRPRYELAAYALQNSSSTSRTTSFRRRWRASRPPSRTREGRSRRLQPLAGRPTSW